MKSSNKPLKLFLAGIVFLTFLKTKDKLSLVIAIVLFLSAYVNFSFYVSTPPRRSDPPKEEIEDVDYTEIKD
jgi:hypothetical protein